MLRDFTSKMTHGGTRSTHGALLRAMILQDFEESCKMLDYFLFVKPFLLHLHFSNCEILTFSYLPMR